MSRGAQRSWKMGTWERVGLAVGLLILFGVSYFGPGLSTNPMQARTLATFVDDKIPFIAGSVWIYFGVYPAAVFPLFAVRCPTLLRRTAAAYAAVILISELRRKRKWKA